MKTLRDLGECRLLRGLLPLLLWLSPAAGAQDEKQPYPGQQLTEWHNLGFQSSVLLDFEKNRWALPTRTEAVRYAKDIAVLLMDDRLENSKGMATRTNRVLRNGTLDWQGWNVRLRFPRSKKDWVDLAIEDNGHIRSIATTGDALRGTYSLGRTLLTAHHWTAKDLGWNKQTIAALTAMDIVRILDRDFVNLYVNRVETNGAGEWLVNVGLADSGEPPFHGVRLSPHFFLLDYSFKP